jgi:ABC-2 type transport system ATP-binding protein
VVADAHPEELRRRSPRHNAVRVRLPADAVERARNAIAALDPVREVEVNGPVNGTAELLVLPRNGIDIAPEVVALLRSDGVPVQELVVERGRLDDVFRELTLGPS